MSIQPKKTVPLPLDGVPKKRRNNKTAGSNYERDCMHDMRNIGFPHVVTSRAESVNRDAQQIDLMNKDEYKHGRLPYNIQCKNSSQIINYHEILVRGKGKTVKPFHLNGEKKMKLVQPMPTVDGVVNVIFHKYTSNKSTSGKFIAQGEYAILKKSDFLVLIQELNIARQNEDL